MKLNKKTGNFLGFLKPKATKLYARGAGTLGNITGLVNESELSNVELKTLTNLMHNSLGIWNSATPGNPSAVAAGGTATFRVVELVQFGEYTAANREGNGDLKKSEIKVQASIAGSEIARYELETLDLPGLAFGSRESFISFIAAGVMKTMSALMDAHYLDVFVQDAIVKEAADANTPLLVKNANWADLGTGATNEAELKFGIQQAYRQIARAQTDVARQLDKYNIGSNQADYGTMLHKDIVNDFNLVIGGAGATNQKALDLTGADSTMTSLAGLSGSIKDHIFLGQNIQAGTVMSKDTAFDFTKVYGVTAHKEAAFLAIQGLVTTGNIAPKSANQIYVTKFNYFKKLIREDLYRLFVTGTLQ